MHVGKKPMIPCCHCIQLSIVIGWDACSCFLIGSEKKPLESHRTASVQALWLDEMHCRDWMRCICVIGWDAFAWLDEMHLRDWMRCIVVLFDWFRGENHLSVTVPYVSHSYVNTPYYLLTYESLYIVYCYYIFLVSNSTGAFIQYLIPCLF
jgi:hypothetical protein